MGHGEKREKAEGEQTREGGAKKEGVREEGSENTHGRGRVEIGEEGGGGGGN